MTLNRRNRFGNFRPSGMKKITIIGSGNAGCLTALESYNEYWHNCEIDIIHSPQDHPIEKFGQGTIPGYPKLFTNVLGVNWYNNSLDATIKTGILYENWGKKQDNIFHPFVMSDAAIHFVPDKLSKMVLESGLFNVIEKTIHDPEKEIDADVIFDCRGRHNKDKSNYDSLINPVNSALLSKKDGKDSDLIWTRAVATPNGWTFVIPNNDSVSYGYLYNNTITSKEDATEDFLERFNLHKVDDDLVFENYVAKNMFIGERTVLQGNRYSFVEPLEATSFNTYQKLVHLAISTILNNRDRSKPNKVMRRTVKEMEIFILWHYQFGSKYDTPFWEYAKSLPFNPNEKFNYFIDNLNNPHFTEDDDYGQWDIDSFRWWMDGVL